MTHECAACGLQVPGRLLMCPECWRLVPEPLQSAVFRTWSEWRDDSSNEGKLTAYIDARDAAVAAVKGAGSSAPGGLLGGV